MVILSGKRLLFGQSRIRKAIELSKSEGIKTETHLERKQIPKKERKKITKESIINYEKMCYN